MQTGPARARASADAVTKVLARRRTATTVQPVALATCQALPRSCPDDAPLLEAFAAAGVEARTVPWDQPGTEWQGFSAVVVRATWDYYLHHERFLAWLDRLEEERVPTWNPVPVLRWNSTKTYLRDLEAKGVPVVPTRFLERGHVARLAGVMDEEGWDEVIVKPAVSAGAHATFKATRADAPGAQRGFEQLLGHADVLVQPFVPEVSKEGEWSFVFLGGAFSHAALKKPAKGDFRCQEKHGGTVRAAKPTKAQVAQAQRVLDAVGHELLYARVDGCMRDGALLLMELEALEPELFFRTSKGSAARLVQAFAEA